LSEAGLPTWQLFKGESMKKTALLLVWLCAVGGLVAAQVEVTNSIQTGRATLEMTGVGLQAAHPSLPIGSTPTIRNTATGREARVTVTGRIPVSAERIIDISTDAARAIGLEPGGYVAVLFSTSTIASVPRMPPGGVNIAINNNVAHIPGTSVTVFNHIRIGHGRNVASPAQRAAFIAEEIERLGIRDVFVREVDDGVMLSLENIMFYDNVAVMLPGGREGINRIAAILRLFPGRNFLVAGHANLGRDDVEWLMQLSINRARVVADYLIGLNIPADRIIVRGYGATRMIADHTNPATQWRNMRAEITILDN